ncbi:PWWP domain-containing protein 3-like [Vigna umbellata]|uniref:PWWP domain-containing protein 3-like n=1 Tax=Vigna umbellata TaxID=87088 RepID=UPI001F5F0DE9|nr:PWWP domain-containing protein 3-like [Vigna umbellata]XP_047164513.1 PWWP domain-containing protein 3-like [Vigna umbellata]XP_047164514.1 PWWP domain-containing protein 3-like [Vigna umbellata]
MGTVEAPSKVPSGCSSPSPEIDKNELREALCALKNGTSENGVGFIGQGNQGLRDGGGVEVVKDRVSETKFSDEMGFSEREREDGCQGLADSEMNGVSSLLKMRESGRNLMFSHGGESDSTRKLNNENGSFEVGMEGGRDLTKIESEDDQIGKTLSVDVQIADISENKDVEMEDLGGEGCGGYSIGDFVWGKVKSHPWWPGRIYDPSDASDLALKLRQKNRILVAYFGDGTFAWCHPSQLKPFEENIEDMVKQSASRAFINAVQEAVNEVGRLLELKMSSLFAEKETEFSRPLAGNSGVKERILIPENGTEKLSDVLVDPAELLSRVKQIAEIISIANVLELEILKARLSAFYLSRGGYRLPMYQAPQPIPGLEDSVEDNNVGSSEGAVEVPVHGPFEEDYSTVPLSPKSGGLNPLGISGNRLNHRIKQKSIAEIMGEDKDVSAKNKEGDATQKVTVRKKRKGTEDTMVSKPMKKKKELFPNTDKNMAGADNDGYSWGKETSDDGALAQLRKKNKLFGIGKASSSASQKETDQEGKAKGSSEKGSLPRERKKSKYLSPPFTIPTRDQRKGEIETESPKVSGKDQVSEPMTTASDKLLESPVPWKLNGEPLQDKFSKELAIEHDHPDSSNYQTSKYDENKTIDTTKVQVPLEEVLHEVRCAAINQQIPTDTNSLERLADFIFIYRSCIFFQGSNYKVYKKLKPGKKRKKPESDIGMRGKDQIQSDHKSANKDSEPKKRRRKNETTSGFPKEKESATPKAGKKGTDKNASGAATLFASFEPGSSVPSKSDLVALYSKFGALNEAETALFSSDYTAQVFFLKASDAEKALSDSLNMNPFGSSKATFRLQYLSSGSKSEKSKSKASSTKKKEKTPAKPSTSLSPGSEASKLNYIKQKLQGLTLILEASDAKSSDIKTKLESEMKGLLEDVNKMVESSS